MEQNCPVYFDNLSVKKYIHFQNQQGTAHALEQDENIIVKFYFYIFIKQKYSAL